MPILHNTGLGLSPSRVVLTHLLGRKQPPARWAHPLSFKPKRRVHNSLVAKVQIPANYVPVPHGSAHLLSCQPGTLMVARTRQGDAVRKSFIPIYNRLQFQCRDVELKKKKTAVKLLAAGTLEMPGSGWSQLYLNHVKVPRAMHGSGAPSSSTYDLLKATSR